MFMFNNVIHYKIVLIKTDTYIIHVQQLYKKREVFFVGSVKAV